MNWRFLTLGAALGFAVAFAPSCGDSKCGPTNCTGCCGEDGKCVEQANAGLNSTCGQSGNQCADCTKTAGQVCVNSACVPGGTGTGTGGGNGAGGNGTTGGGTGGSGTGGGSDCAGCRLPSGTCAPGNTITNCGSSGEACVACQTGELCTNNKCQNAAPNAVPGDPCNTDNDCSTMHLSDFDLQVNVKPYCKKVSVTLGAPAFPYPNGYCTKRCIDSTDCDEGGADDKSQCGYFLGQVGELENICFGACTGQANECRPGYACLIVDEEPKVLGVCYPVSADGGLPDIDAGPGFGGAAAGACTGNADCRPPDNFGCIPQQSDGTYPDGMCTANCGASMSDAWCGENGVCAPALYRDNAYGFIVQWACAQGCGVLSDGGVGITFPDGGPFPDCRTGYSCERGVCEGE